MPLMFKPYIQYFVERRKMADKKVPLFEYEIFPVHKARVYGPTDLPKKHNR